MTTCIVQNPSREMKAGREERRVGNKDKEMCACQEQTELLITAQCTNNIDNSYNALTAEGEKSEHTEIG